MTSDQGLFTRNVVQSATNGSYLKKSHSVHMSLCSLLLFYSSFACYFVGLWRFAWHVGHTFHVLKNLRLDP